MMCYALEEYKVQRESGRFVHVSEKSVYSHMASVLLE